MVMNMDTIQCTDVRNCQKQRIETNQETEFPPGQKYTNGIWFLIL